MWFWYIWLALSVMLPLSLSVLVKARAGEGRFTAFLLVNFFAGLIAASLQKEVLVKPFAYALPGHRKIPRRVIFHVGWSVSLVSALVYLAYPGLTPGQCVAAVTAAFFLGMGVYLLAVLPVFFGTKQAGAWIGLLYLLVLGLVFFDVHVLLETAVVSCLYESVAFGLLVCAFAWHRLGGESFAREFCGREYLGLCDGMSWQKTQNYRKRVQARKLGPEQGTYARALEDFFILRMAARGTLGASRYSVGAFYNTFGKYPPGSILKGVSVMLLIFLCYSYFWEGRGLVVFCVFPIFLGVSLRLPPEDSLLLPAGRREKFLASLAVVAGVSVLALGVVVALWAVSLALEPLMPELVLRGRRCSYHSMHLTYVYLALLVVPAGSAIRLFLPDNLLKMLLVMIIVMSGCFWLPRLEPIGPAAICAITILTWALFTLLLRYHCTRRCLVR